MHEAAIGGNEAVAQLPLENGAEHRGREMSRATRTALNTRPADGLHAAVKKEADIEAKCELAKMALTPDGLVPERIHSPGRRQPRTEQNIEPRDDPGTTVLLGAKDRPGIPAGHEASCHADTRPKAHSNKRHIYPSICLHLPPPFERRYGDLSPLGYEGECAQHELYTGANDESLPIGSIRQRSRV
ncbi:hypothetical protein GP486_005671 [Trichoglossum hirsutum]|uniref:Uncharacterized protein n=1 Tax=Trichoglossum hirsutum TaxID=265104 RepID=A0A9P8RLU0_9PEZI|nr:hypothetical protein GP486_005671 [Trichoglossum hirsutum]